LLNSVTITFGIKSKNEIIIIAIENQNIGLIKIIVEQRCLSENMVEKCLYTIERNIE